MHGNGASLLVARINSWSDTGTVQGPTGRREVSGPAEDLRPYSEVEAGVNFRPASGVRVQVAHGSGLLCNLPDGVQDQIPGGPG